ncbi:MAG: hypothetical protein KIT69_14535 [Propionibacteriaceae bacterium]|nr:hypothetical protein [Propionibacteriaceae bacterium]
MRKLLALVCVALVVTLSGCSSPGDVSQATVTLGESEEFSHADLQSAADSVLETFRGFEGCTLMRLSFDEGFSQRQLSLASPPLPEGEDAVVFTSEFRVDSTGHDNGLVPNSIYSDWTWTVARADASAPWAVKNYGVA